MSARAIGTGLCVLAASVSLCAAQGLTLDELREQRSALAHQPRRIIANNDGCDVLYFPGDAELTTESFLAQRTTALAGKHVDAIAYCTISSGFSHFTHDTKVGTVLTRQSADYGILPDRRNVSQEMIDAGTDCLQAVTDYAHENAMEVFWSMRMNDTHDTAHTPEKPYLLYPPLKVDHPDWLVGDHVKRTRIGRWSSVDYARQEIRDLAFGYIEEVCQNYDVDGVELDYFRHLCYFASVANGGKASDEEREMMTGLMRRIREMTEEEGLKRGRPILVTVRVPDSVEYCREMGFDIETWLEDGLVDILHTTCYFRLNPWDYSVDLGHRYDVPVYPCISDSRVRGETRFKRGSIESYRGRAMNAWAAGADGIHLFNYFNPNGPVFAEIGDPATMATLNKLYFVTCRDGNPDSFLAGGSAYRTVPLLTPNYPMSIAPDKPLEITLPIGEDFGEGAVATLHLEMPTVTRPEQLTVALNGHALSESTVADGWIDFPLDPEWVERGANQVSIAIEAAELPGEGEWTIEWTAADGVPGSPWTRDPGSERTEEELIDGSLRIADRGEVSGDYHYYRNAWGANPGEPLVIEARAKVVADSSYVLFGNGDAHERLGLWPDRIDVWSNSDLRYDMDTTDDFHDYRIETVGDDLKVYVDGELRIDAPGQFKGGGRYPNQLGFGAANSTMVGGAYWESLRARSVGQGCRDLAVSVNYP